MEFYYKFPVVRGLQAGRLFYIAMVPLNMLKVIFWNEDEYVLPEFRAQRKLNEARIPDIKDYILRNRKTYVFSALAASIDGNYRFIPSKIKDVGELEVSMDSHFLINDGQHRKAAILEAIEEDSKLGQETISVVFYEDMGLKRSQQMFTDLNRHAIKATNSLAELYDQRDPVAVATKEVVDNVPFFSRFVDKERDILGKNSSKFFTLSSVYKANVRIIGNNECNEELTKFLIRFWHELSLHIAEWNDVMDKKISKMDLRENYIVTLSVTLNAFGRLGRYFKEAKRGLKVLKKFDKVDWSRDNLQWRNRIIKSDGKVISNETAVIYACSQLKKILGIPLSDDEMQKEKCLRVVKNEAM